MELKTANPLIDSPKRTLKELCTEDKARVGQLVQKIALETATRKKAEEKISKETKELNKLLDMLKSEQSSLLKESETLHESLMTSMSHIESFHNSQILHSIESNANQKSSINDVSVCTQFKESSEMSVQTVPEREKNNESLEQTKKRFVGEDMRRIIDKAQETSARLERFFSVSEISPNQSFRSDRFDFCCKCEGKVEEKANEKKIDMMEEEIIIIEKPFYDDYVLDVIDQMEDFDEEF